MLVETIHYETLDVNIHTDDDPPNPRTDYDNAGIMVCQHSGYTLGDKEQSFQDMARDIIGDDAFEEIDNRAETRASELMDAVDRDEITYGSREYCARQKDICEAMDNELLEAIQGVATILPLYLYDHSGITMSCSSFSCPWDSGQVGYIYITHETAKNEGIDNPEEYLKGEVETYDQYLCGDVYCFVIEDETGVLDSLGGIYGLDYAKEEAKEMAEYLDRERMTERAVAFARALEASRPDMYGEQ